MATSGFERKFAEKNDNNNAMDLNDVVRIFHVSSQPDNYDDPEEQVAGCSLEKGPKQSPLWRFPLPFSTYESSAVEMKYSFNFRKRKALEMAALNHFCSWASKRVKRVRAGSKNG